MVREWEVGAGGHKKARTKSRLYVSIIGEFTTAYDFFISKKTAVWGGGVVVGCCDGAG